MRWWVEEVIIVVVLIGCWKREAGGVWWLEGGPLFELIFRVNGYLVDRGDLL